MIGPQHVVDRALAAATVDETTVIVTETSEASLRWANSSMTTNGASTSRTTSVISVVRKGGKAYAGSVQTGEVDPEAIPALVKASEEAARQAPEARDSAPPITGAAPAPDWDGPVPATGPGVFGPLASSLSVGFGRADQQFGFARHELTTTFLATSAGVRRRFTQPTGYVELNAKRDGASAWVGVNTPDFVDVPADRALQELATRLDWASTTVSLPAGRYPTLLPPSAVADLMIYLAWSMDGRGAQEGRTALSATGGGTRVGEQISNLPVTLYSDPSAAPLQTAPFVATSTSSDVLSAFDNGMDVERVDWIRDGVVNALAYPRAAADEFGAPVAVPADNYLMTGGTETLDQMIANTERALLLTTLWYIRPVDPVTLLLTGLTRDGVYLVENGRVSAAVNNFRFNESPLNLLHRATAVGATEVTLPREWSDYAPRAAMPPMMIPDFHMSTVSQAQ